jgi:hypothetical protein
VSAGRPKVIVCASGETGAAVTWNVRVTSPAAEYVPLPPWDAVIEQVPVATSVTVVPEIVQTERLLETSVTERPLDADAESETGPWSTRVSAGCANVIVCACGTAVTWKVRVTSAAAAYVPLPACVAVIEQVPTETSVTLVPETVQTLVLFEVDETARPLDAEADNATGPWSTRVSDGCANVIACASGAAVTWNERVTFGAPP